MVWIHDTYLLMCPGFLKKKDIRSNIGFSFHAPWPSSDIYKTFQWRAEILKSLFSCDLIGFHLFDYARNFLSSVSRIMEITDSFKMVGGQIGIE